jgi:hypothetical protein
MFMTPASTLRTALITLRTLIALNWLYGLLIFALLTLSFEAEDWTWRALGVGPVSGHEEIITGMRAIMVIGILSVPLSYLFLRELHRIVLSVSAHEPFARANVGRLKTIAWSLVALELFHLAVTAIASSVSTTEIPLTFDGSFDLTGWLAILLLFVLAQVFMEGARMRDDVEGMV